jgi:ATP-dependent helicase/nuclease subunit B
MKSSSPHPLPWRTHLASTWDAWADAVTKGLQGSGAAARDAIILLPWAALVDPARRALARHPGWMPRVETVRTLSAALTPPHPQTFGTLTGDGVLDRLGGAALLRDQAWAKSWSDQDPRAFAQGVAAMVDAAQALADAAAARRPERRAAWWQQAREALAAGSGVGEREAALARVALEWAASAAPPASDALFALRPSAWLVLAVGGSDAVAAAVVEHAAEHGVPCLTISADAPADPFDLIRDAADDPAAGLRLPTVWVADDGEAEAMAAASAVLSALRDRADDDRAPVALIAQDRQAVRRVRALLARRGLRIADETGWALSTSRAGARLMALLRASSKAASPDERLDALKADLGDDDQAALNDLESLWRSDGATPSDPVRRARAQALRERERTRWSAFAGSPNARLTAWLGALDRLLATGDRASDWHDDPAGRAVRQALRLDEPEVFEPCGVRFSLAGFTAWVAEVLESSVFSDAGAEPDAQVVVTPMARAPLRPFSAIVMPGTDASRLGPPSAAADLLGDAVSTRLGMPSRADRARRQAQGFVQLLRAPRLVLLRRRADGNEAQEASPLIGRLEQSLPAGRREDLRELAASMSTRTVAPNPVDRPLPNAASALPARLSATQVEALRDCPYRFFAQAVLRLRPVDELDAEVDKRLFGSWLHATLERFHDQRAADPAPPAATEATAGFTAAADAALDALCDGMDAAQAMRRRQGLLPYRAGLPALAGRYLAWLAGHEREGWRFADGERPMSTAPSALDGMRLAGRIDRIDSRRAGAGGDTPPGRDWLLIDYKTGSADDLKRRLRDPLEDTQLAFYAAISAGEIGEADRLSAQYLALDDRDAIKVVAHPDVRDSAARLVEGLADEVARLRAGAPMPALGEGRICEHCDARGLCRRDRWAPDGSAAP